VVTVKMIAERRLIWRKPTRTLQNSPTKYGLAMPFVSGSQTHQAQQQGSMKIVD
jgi:hypothetical protein